MRIVFIGIGGIGLSSIAHLLIDCGISNIIGIDSNIQQQSLATLKDKGLELYEHGQIECKEDDFVLYSDAVFETPEYKSYCKLKTLNGKLTMWSYFDFVGKLSKYFKTISIAGSHGKSTTTSMAISAMNKLVPEFGLGIAGVLMKEFGGSNILINSDYKPYIQKVVETILNGVLIGIEEKIDSSDAPYFVIEADEFNRHFHLIDTDIALITNIEHDHTNTYPTVQDYLDAFDIFVSKVKSKVFTHPNVYAVIARTCLPAGRAGINFEGDEANQEKRYLLTKNQHFDFKYVFGTHNQANANLVYSLLQYLHNDTPTVNGELSIVNGLESFPGIRRRQEFLRKGENGALITDYAHHPTEVKATYDAVKEHFPDYKIIGIFQPHQAQRVLEFQDQFIQSVRGFDELYIFPIYAARENFDELANRYPELLHTGSFLEFGKVFANHCKGTFIETIDQAWGIIHNLISANGNLPQKTIIVMMTAGNLDREIRKRIS